MTVRCWLMEMQTYDCKATYWALTLRVRTSSCTVYSLIGSVVDHKMPRVHQEGMKMSERTPEEMLQSFSFLPFLITIPTVYVLQAVDCSDCQRAVTWDIKEKKIIWTGLFIWHIPKILITLVDIQAGCRVSGPFRVQHHFLLNAKMHSLCCFSAVTS